jgi:3',5'-cyclic AMP phosphodiesterase CpdA
MVVIAHLSDIHFGDANQRALEAALAALNTLRPDCIVATGDITQAGRRREFAAAALWFAQLQAPVVGCPGNHDAPVFALHRRFTTPFSRFRALGLGSYWVDPEGRASVSSFNSARALQWRPDWSQGVYAPRDVARAIAVGARSAPQGWRIVACHHPPATPAGSPIAARTRRGALGAAMLSDAPRTILLSGHVHGFSLQQRGEALFITAPSLASSRDRAQGLGFVVLKLALNAAPAVTPWMFGAAGFAPLPGANAAQAA